jgi:D-3-phosphoglycerate dehydrogenase
LVGALFLSTPLPLALALGAERPGPVRETADVALVEVPVRVLGRDGNPIRGLTEGDFQVFDDGRRQEIVGFDAVDLQACTRAGTVATITPDGARGPVATATLSMLLSVLHNTVMKDRLVREKSWDLRERFMGTGLTGQTVGLLGVGNTGGELVRLLQPFGVRCVGYDPFCPPERAIELGVELMELEDVASCCDALIVMAVLTEQTYHIINAALLDRMKSTAVVVNMARGPIINESDLIAALVSGSIAGAGLDVFEEEPVTNELIGLENVTLSPHCLSWTDEMSLGNGSSCVRAIVAVARIAATVSRRRSEST